MYSCCDDNITISEHSWAQFLKEVSSVVFVVLDDTVIICELPQLCLSHS